MTSEVSLNGAAVDLAFAWQGLQRDEATGFYRADARDYDPVSGRWTAEDPSGFAAGDPNLYRYVGNSPLNYTDPTGTTQAGNPLTNLNVNAGGYSGGKVAAAKPVNTAVGSGFNAYSTTKSIDQYYFDKGLKNPLSAGTYNFAAPTRQQISNAQLNPHGRPVSVEYVGGGPAGDVFRNVPGRLTHIANTTSSPAVAFIAQLGANLSKPTSYVAGGLADSLLPYSDPDIVKTYSDGTRQVTPGVPSTGALANQASLLTSPFLKAPVRSPSGITAGPNNSLNILNPHFTPNGTRVLQNLTNRENALLGADLSRAATVLSRKEQIAAAGHPGIARAQYGNAIERLVAGEIEADPTRLGILFKHVGGPSQPDFIGRGFLEGTKYDITTPGQAIRHLNRPYGEGLNIIPYQRPAGFP